MPARKRSAPEPAQPNGARRRSGRSGAQKSSYFEDSEQDKEEEAPPKKKRGRPSTKKAPAKEESDEDQYKEETEEDVVEEEEEEEDEDVVEEEEPPKKKRGRGRPPAKSPAKKTASKKKAAAREESDGDQYKDKPEEAAAEEDDDDDDDEGVRKVEIIPLEKMRDDGGVEYEDDKLHKNTLLFLRDLKANNKRPWLKAHDGEYRRSLKDWQTFVEATTAKLIEVDETIPELPAKDVIFRIHRDIRFSKDPTPYKAHFSAAWSRTGRKGPYAVYYIHCEPKACFIGGGLWMPDAQYIAKLRASIDERPGRWRRALNNPIFKNVFFPGVKESAGEEGVVKAFVEKNKGNALKKRPMGYDVTHRDIELLKLKNFTVGTSIDEHDILCSDDAQEKLADIMRGLHPFIAFLNSIVMPDPNVDEDDDTEDDEDDENGTEEEEEEEDEGEEEAGKEDDDEEEEDE
ncbi:hypothetical protein PT974_12041 [Cladobotryum mycophilum]|uniref:DUF2461 domain-containing protein n=1 Tax=Cladobotryum mycophilum TaxID=491253 RepID=A0ABR0S800_9HYPO